MQRFDVGWNTLSKRTIQVEETLGQVRYPVVKCLFIRSISAFFFSRDTFNS